MNVKTIGPVGLSVDELIEALQKVSSAGHGKAPAHALFGEHTGPVRSVEVVRSWGFGSETVALVLTDDDAEAAGAILRAKGNAMTGEG